MSYEGKEKKTFIMTTNVKGPNEERKVTIRLQSKFIGFIELWQELFDLDLYAYRLKFFDKTTNKEITCLQQAQRIPNCIPRVELVVQAAGG